MGLGKLRKYGVRMRYHSSTRRHAHGWKGYARKHKRRSLPGRHVPGFSPSGPSGSPDYVYAMAPPSTT